MKVLNKRNLIFVILLAVILITSVLPVIFNENVAISFNSLPAIVFFACSFIYAIIAFLNKERENLFVIGKNKLLKVFLHSLKEDAPNTDGDEYKKDFALSAFIFCASVPLYIPIAFFAKNFYATLSLTLTVAILRILITFAIILISRLKNIKKDNIKDENDRKEQERRESMGKWK